MSHKEPQNSLITEVAIGLKSFSIDAVDEWIGQDIGNALNIDDDEVSPS